MTGRRRARGKARAEGQMLAPGKAAALLLESMQTAHGAPPEGAPEEAVEAHAILLVVARESITRAGTASVTFGSAHTLERDPLIALLRDVVGTMNGPPPPPRPSEYDPGQMAAAMMATARERHPDLLRRFGLVLVVAVNSRSWSITFESVVPTVGVTMLERFLAGIAGS